MLLGILHTYAKLLFGSMHFVFLLVFIHIVFFHIFISLLKHSDIQFFFQVW